MRALALDFEKRKLCEREVPDPALEREDEVLFRVLETGVCGTDRELASFHLGRPPDGESYLVIGHEALGRVVRTGPAVSDLYPGDLVVPMVRRSCEPPCAQCADGRRDLCLTGGYDERGIFGEHGYFAELAVDRARDLVRVPDQIAESAVLIEPLSVVEKAASAALRMHAGEPRTALVVGAGTIGLLSALVLRLRGLEVDVCSREHAGSARARLVESCGARYLLSPERAADVVIEAAGAAEAAVTGAGALAPLGVLMLLGAPRVEELSLIDLIVGNRVIAGSVNASPEAFQQAIADLGSIPAGVLRSMIERVGFADYPRSIQGPPAAVPKTVHVIG